YVPVWTPSWPSRRSGPPPAPTSVPCAARPPAHWTIAEEGWRTWKAGSSRGMAHVGAVVFGEGGNAPAGRVVVGGAGAGRRPPTLPPPAARTSSTGEVGSPVSL